MAKLETIISLLKINIPETLISEVKNKKFKKLKRRPWLIENNSVENNIDGLGNSLGNNIDGLGNTLGNNIDGLGNSLGNNIDGLGNTLGNNIDGLGNSLGNNIDGLGNSLGNNIDGLGNTLGDYFKNSSRRENANLVSGVRNVNFIFSTLCKSKEKIFKYLLNICVENGSLDTGPIKSKIFAENISIPYQSFKTILGRLVSIGLIKRNIGKTSQNGYINIHLNKQIKNLAIYYYLGNNLDNTCNNSSSNNSTTTIQSTISENQLSPEWMGIDFEQLSFINFTRAHLVQIAKQSKLSFDIVQNSIYAFAFDLRENNKAQNIKGDPINYFMGILCSGRPYNFSSNYESPQDKALRIYRENINNITQKRKEKEKEIMNLAFENWFSNLTNEQKRNIIPSVFTYTSNLEQNKILKSAAKNKFEEKIWPEEKNKILSCG